MAVLPLCGCNADFWRGAAAGWNQTYEDHEYRRQRVFDRWDRDRDRRLDKQRNALMREQNNIIRGW